MKITFSHQDYNEDVLYILKRRLGNKAVSIRAKKSPSGINKIEIIIDQDYCLEQKEEILATVENSFDPEWYLGKEINHL